MRFRTMILLCGVAAAVVAAQSGNDLFQKGLAKERADGDLRGAIQIYQQVASMPGAERKLAADALFRIAECQQALGNAEARKTYQRIVQDFADQRDVAGRASERLSAMGAGSGAHETGIITRQVWVDATDTEGAPSPDGRHLTFVDWTTGDLAIRDLATSSNHRLTNKGAWGESEEFALFSAFSPEGKQIVYAWFNKNFSWDLRIVPAAAGGDVPKPRLLYHSDDLQYLQPAQWSPDGKYILALFTRKDRTNQIALVSATDGSARILKTFDWRAPTKMSFSPDGRYIAYDFPPKEDFPERDIYVLAADGSRESRVVEHPANDFSPVWTPDGKSILFISDRTGTPGAWIAPLADGKPQGSPEPVKAHLGNAQLMGFARTGALFYASQKGGFNIYISALDLTSKVQQPPKKIPERIEGINLMPEWSPDGRYLAYIRGMGGDGPGISKTVCSWSLESGEERELRPKLGYLGGLRWAPDGRSLFASGSDRKGRKGIYQIDAHTGEASAVVLAPPGGDLRHPQWSSDYEFMFYVQADEQFSRLMVQDRRTGTGKELLRLERPGINTIALSPDNRQIALLVSDTARKSLVLKVMPAAGGEPRELAADVAAQLLAWQPGSDTLIFGRRSSGGTPGTELWRVSAAGGTAEKLGMEKLAKRNLRIHPDGRRVAFFDGDAKADVWALENFLPTLKASR